MCEAMHVPVLKTVVSRLIGPDRALRIAKPILYHLPSRLLRIGTPALIAVEPTNICNLRCPLCPTNNCMPRPRGYMALDNFKSLIDELAGKLRKIDLWNYGESLLHPDIYEMIEYASRHRIAPRLTTNGTLLSEEHVENILSSGLERIAISLDGASRHAHEKYRVGSDFASTVKGIRKLCMERRRRMLQRPEIILEFLVMRHNQHEIPAIKKLAASLGVDVLALKPVQIGIGNWLSASARENLARKYLPIAKNGSPSYLFDNSITTAEYVKNPPICHWFVRSVVLWNGDVTICCEDSAGAYTVGNAFKDGGFMKVFTSPKYRTLRRKIIRAELPICKTCSEHSARKYKQVYPRFYFGAPNLKSINCISGF